MKRIFLFVCIFLSCFTLAAKQPTYSVYEFKGAVLCKQQTTSGWTAWNPVTNNLRLGAFDSLEIKSGTYLRLQDELTDDVYRSVSEGKMLVAELVIRARKHSTQRVEQQVNENIRKTVNSDEQIAMSVYGTSTREYQVFSEINFVVNHLGYIISDDNPDQVTVVMEEDTTAVLGAVTIANTVKYKKRTYSVVGIEDEAFKDCQSITSVVIADIGQTPIHV